MKIIDELLVGCFLIDPEPVHDERGYFVKTFDDEKLKECGIKFEVKDTYYSVSHKNVIRGMHFQEPPHAHGKIVQCARGEALDVLLDLRSGSDFGRCTSIILNANNRFMVYAPLGLAHGFLSTRNDTLMLYSTDSIHKRNFDKGVRWDSFNFQWGKEPFILSERDRVLPSLSEIRTSF